MYLSCATRPDISYAVSKLSQFVSNPGNGHWEALERVFCYLKGTSSYGIHYSGYPRVLQGYSDSNWISDAELTALDTAFVEADCLRELVMNLPVVDKPVPAILMNCDNQTVIARVNSFKDNIKSSRHVKRRLKSVRKIKTSGVIALDYVPTAKNLADPFTKGLSRKVIDEASREMGMRP
ncbi:hypothetical protein U9M48_004335, partial [Paspalum notatum var. saurae]